MLSLAKNLYRSLPLVRRTANRLLGRRIHDPEIKLKDRVFGTAYGGWSVDLTALKSSSIVYSFGVGEDISFDLALIEAIGCEVNAFDPTPIANQWIKRQRLPPEFKFHPIGVAGVNDNVEFFLPADDGRHSFSLYPATDALEPRTVKCPVRTVSTIMKHLGHDHVDLAKFDIEGFEFEVVDNIIQDRIRPRTILIEYHHSIYGIHKSKTMNSVRSLQAYGYKIFWISDLGLEYGFVDTLAARL